MRPLLLMADKALLGEDLQLTGRAAVVVEKDRILFAGGRDEALHKYPEAEILDLGDRFLMPGMIDSHSHTSLDARLLGHLEMMDAPPGELTIRAIKNVQDDLMSGITACRILGERYYVDVAVQDAVDKGELPGPRLLVAGIGMRALHGHGFVGLPHTGVLEFQKTCRENILRKVQWLKIFVTAGAPPVRGGFIPSFLSLAEIETVAGEAKRMGKRTSAHCIGGEGLVNCIRGGIDVIDHAYAATEEDLELIAKNGRFVCLTPSVFMDLERNEANTPALKASIARSREQVTRVMEKIVTSGVKYAIGTDALHAHMPLEAKYAVQLGATTREALKGITVWGAELCGILESCGSLTAGKYADLIAVEGDPLQNIEDLSNLRFVMKGGVRYV